jgi:hypothetical protein
MSSARSVKPSSADRDGLGRQVIALTGGADPRTFRARATARRCIQPLVESEVVVAADADQPAPRFRGTVLVTFRHPAGGVVVAGSALPVAGRRRVSGVSEEQPAASQELGESGAAELTEVA